MLPEYVILRGALLTEMLIGSWLRGSYSKRAEHSSDGMRQSAGRILSAFPTPMGVFGLSHVRVGNLTTYRDAFVK